MSYEGRKKSESDIAQLHLVMLSSRILHEETQMCPRNARLLKEFARFVVHKKGILKCALDCDVNKSYKSQNPVVLQEFYIINYYIYYSTV